MAGPEEKVDDYFFLLSMISCRPSFRLILGL
jgi:hypothetical protein